MRRKDIKLIFLLFISVLILFSCQKAINSNNKNMKITSVFKHNETIPVQYTCDGENISPPIIISGASAGTKSLALIMDDPDSPSGDFVHWLLWNIPADTKEIKENNEPSGAIMGKNDFDRLNWGGPCPPSGIHHYQFKIFALDVKLDLMAGATKDQLMEAMSGHILDQALLVGLYQRNK